MTNNQEAYNDAAFSAEKIFPDYADCDADMQERIDALVASIDLYTLSDFLFFDLPESGNVVDDLVRYGDEFSAFTKKHKAAFEESRFDEVDVAPVMQYLTGARMSLRETFNAITRGKDYINAQRKEACRILCQQEEHKLRQNIIAVHNKMSEFSFMMTEVEEMKNKFPVLKEKNKGRLRDIATHILAGRKIHALLSEELDMSEEDIRERKDILDGKMRVFEMMYSSTLRQHMQFDLYEDMISDIELSLTSILTDELPHIQDVMRQGVSILALMKQRDFIERMGDGLDSSQQGLLKGLQALDGIKKEDFNDALVARYEALKEKGARLAEEQEGYEAMQADFQDNLNRVLQRNVETSFDGAQKLIEQGSEAGGVRQELSGKYKPKFYS